MSILNYEEMTLESDTFQAARETFNLMMQKLFRKMEQSDMDEGSIDLKISIELNEDFVPQEDGTTVRIKKPLIKHKISTVVPVKDSADGKRDTGMCLVYDEKLKRYVLKYVSTGGQMNILIWSSRQRTMQILWIVKHQPLRDSLHTSYRTIRRMRNQKSRRRKSRTANQTV